MGLGLGALRNGHPSNVLFHHCSDILGKTTVPLKTQARRLGEGSGGSDEPPTRSCRSGPAAYRRSKLCLYQAFCSLAVGIRTIVRIPTAREQRQGPALICDILLELTYCTMNLLPRISDEREFLRTRTFAWCLRALF